MNNTLQWTPPIPTDIPEGSFPKWNGESWEIVELPKIEVFDITNPKEDLSSLTYSELRKREYPPIYDYIDGIIKGDSSQIQKYIQDCLAVKQKYPKPTIPKNGK